MTTLMLYLGLMMVGAVATIGLAGWASRGDKMRRNIVGFLLAVLGSYAAGFLIDMLGTTFAGELPAANVIAPAFSWLAIAVVATFAAVPPSAGALVLASPFAINAALAFVATVVRSRHLAVSVVLAILCVFVFAVRRRQEHADASRASRNRAAA